MQEENKGILDKKDEGELKPSFIIDFLGLNGERIASVSFNLEIFSRSNVTRRIMLERGLNRLMAEVDKSEIPHGENPFHVEIGDVFVRNLEN